MVWGIICIYVKGFEVVWFFNRRRIFNIEKSFQYKDIYYNIITVEKGSFKYLVIGEDLVN